MSSFEMVADAVAFATAAHAGQTDKAGKPYIEHVERVARRVTILLDLFPDLSEQQRCNVVIAAYCHDTREDCGKTIEEIAERFNDEVGVMVRALSRNEHPGIAYAAHIKGLADSYLAGDLPIGTLVIKYADNLDNSDPDRINQLPVEQRSISNRYERSKQTIRGALPQLPVEDPLKRSSNK